MMQRGVIYYRVSTDMQTMLSQKLEVEEYAKEHSIHIVEVIAEIDSGAKDDRPGFQRVRQLARRKSIDVILVYRLDRFSRSASTAITSIIELDTLGVGFISVTQPILNLGKEVPFRKTIIAAFSEIAELERQTLIERTKAGIKAYRKKNGGKWGRKSKITEEALKELKYLVYELGIPHEKVADITGIPRGSIYGILERAKRDEELIKEPPQE